MSSRVTASFGRNCPSAVPRTIPLAARRPIARCAGIPAMSVKVSAHAGATSASTRNTATNMRITCLLWVATIEISVCESDLEVWGTAVPSSGRCAVRLPAIGLLLPHYPLCGPVSPRGSCRLVQLDEAAIGVAEVRRAAPVEVARPHFDGASTRPQGFDLSVHFIHREGQVIFVRGPARLQLSVALLVQEELDPVDNERGGFPGLRRDGVVP